MSTMVSSIENKQQQINKMMESYKIIRDITRGSCTTPKYSLHEVLPQEQSMGHSTSAEISTKSLQLPKCQSQNTELVLPNSGSNENKLRFT